MTAKAAAGLFNGRRTQKRIPRIQGLLETLADLGQVVESDKDKFTVA